MLVVPRKLFFRTSEPHASFLFVCSEQGKRNANNEKNTIISDNIHICLDDFKPEESIMKRLFKNLLDCHISFIDSPGGKKGVTMQVLWETKWLGRGLPRNRFILRRKPSRNDWNTLLHCSRLRSWKQLS